MGDPGVVFTMFQIESRANGGFESLTEILRVLPIRRVVVTDRETPATQRLRDIGCEVHVHALLGGVPPDGVNPLVHRARRFVDLARFSASFRRILAESGARVVHCNEFNSLVHTAPVARAFGARIVFNVRCVQPRSVGYTYKWRGARAIADRVVVLSREMQREIDAEMRAPEPLRSAPVDFIYSVVDFDRMHPAAPPERAALRASLGVADGALAIACVATVNARKGQLALLEQTVAPWLRENPRGHMYFVGDCDASVSAYARACREATARLGLEDRVTWAGFTSRAEDWYRAADFTVLASDNEGLPRCVIESLACGTPVASFGVCSAREILEPRRTGLVVPKGDYAGLLRAFDALAKDDAERRAMGERGAALARELFTPESAAAQYLAVYRDEAMRARSGHLSE